jgi:hypothetical protein
VPHCYTWLRCDTARHCTPYHDSGELRHPLPIHDVAAAVTAAGRGTGLVSAGLLLQRNQQTRLPH